MKKFFLLISLMCSLIMMAQVPQGINYQAAVRDANGLVAANANATFQMSFIDKADNSVDYVESFNTSTDQFGLVNFVLGQGLPNGALFSTLDWTKQFKLKVEVNMGQGFIPLGIQDLVSVPYALEAGHADMSLTELNNVDVNGAVSGEVLMFDGANWIPAVVSGSFGLPFIASDPNLLSFAITNTSALGGTALTGKTTTNHVNATGIRGESTGANGTGVHGKATGATSFGVLGTNTTGVAIKGTTETTTSGTAALCGENNGTAGSGVLGVANFASGTGVKGESNTGVGVVGYSGSNVGVSGSTISGTALQGSSTSGYALSTSGNVKIAGGNTSPGAGKVLTSDAQGNATWQPSSSTPKIAFRAQNPSSVNYSSGVSTTLLLQNEVYDLSNNYDINTDRFTAPVGGVYHFDAVTNILLASSIHNFNTGQIILIVNHNGIETEAAQVTEIQETNSSLAVISFQISADIQLASGDQVYVKIYQTNDGDLSASNTAYSATGHYFNGHLVFQN